MAIPFDVCLSHVHMEEKPHTRPTRSTHSPSSSSSSASRTSSTSSSVTIRTPTSDSESTAPPSLHTFITSTPRPKMERFSSESSTSGSVGDLCQDRDYNPAAKSTYLILHQPTNLALTLVGGWFALHKVPVVLGKGHPLEGKCNWHWHCVETDGWLGFRNAACGRYLGLNAGEKGTASGQPSNGYWVVSVNHGA